MKTIILVVALSISLSISTARANPKDDEFQKIAHDYIERELETNPEEATELGDHRFDGRLTDYSPEARAKQLAIRKTFRDTLYAIDWSQGAVAHSVDLRILKS